MVNHASIAEAGAVELDVLGISAIVDLQHTVAGRDHRPRAGIPANCQVLASAFCRERQREIGSATLRCGDPHGFIAQQDA